MACFLFRFFLLLMWISSSAFTTTVLISDIWQPEALCLAPACIHHRLRSALFTIIIIRTAAVCNHPANRSPWIHIVRPHKEVALRCRRRLRCFNAPTPALFTFRPVSPPSTIAYRLIKSVLSFVLCPPLVYRYRHDSLWSNHMFRVNPFEWLTSNQTAWSLQVSRACSCFSPRIPILFNCSWNFSHLPILRRLSCCGSIPGRLSSRFLSHRLTFSRLLNRYGGCILISCK